MAANAAKLDGIVSAARFVIDLPGTIVGRMDFSELGGINSKVASTEYLYSNSDGTLVHTKQFGKTEPPTITLKRAVDKSGTNRLLVWHNLARSGSADARCDGSLSVYPAGNDEATAVYFIHGAWLSDLTISSLKAGSSEVALIECKITCERIEGKQ
jgi:phage tail-like protein